MRQYVRVRDKSTGNRFSRLAAAALDPERFEVLDEPAVDECGDPLPGERAEPTNEPPTWGSLSITTDGQTATDTEES
jgi:hypothetical protein